MALRQILRYATSGCFSSFVLHTSPNLALAKGSQHLLALVASNPTRPAASATYDNFLSSIKRKLWPGVIPMCNLKQHQTSSILKSAGKKEMTFFLFSCIFISNVAIYSSTAASKEVCFRSPDRMDYSMNSKGECCVEVFGQQATCMPGDWYDKAMAAPKKSKSKKPDVQIEWANPNEMNEPNKKEEFFYEQDDAKSIIALCDTLFSMFGNGEANSKTSEAMKERCREAAKSNNRATDPAGNVGKSEGPPPGQCVGLICN